MPTLGDLAKKNNTGDSRPVSPATSRGGLAIGDSGNGLNDQSSTSNTQLTSKDQSNTRSQSLKPRQGTPPKGNPQKNMAKPNRRDKTPKSQSPIAYSQSQPAPADKEDFAAYLAMRLGVNPGRIAAALTDYAERDNDGGDNGDSRFAIRDMETTNARSPMPSDQSPMIKTQTPNRQSPIANRSEAQVATSGETSAFRWAGESMASEEHRHRNEDSWVVFAPTNAIGVFDGVTVATQAADASAKAQEIFTREVRRATPSSAMGAARGLKQLLAMMNAEFLQTNDRQQGTHLATTAAIGMVVSDAGKPALAYASVGDSRIGIWHKRAAHYELAEIDDGFVRMLLLPPRQRPDWVAKLLVSHDLAPDLQIPLTEAARLVAALDQEHDPSGNSPLAQALFAERNLISQSLGSNAIQIHSGVLPLTSGDRVIFTTDGIHDNLTENELLGIVSRANLHELAAALVVRAHEVSRSTSPRAKKDDMTAVVIEIK